MYTHVYSCVHVCVEPKGQPHMALASCCLPCLERQFFTGLSLTKAAQLAAE